MIERYSRPEMQRLWSEENKFRRWLDVELAVLDAWQSLGKVPAPAVKQIKAKAGFDVGRIGQLEKETHHDVVAFVEAVSEKIGPLSAYFHMGLTSSDLLDTTNALLLRESADVLIADLEELGAVFADLAHRHRDTVQIGRTHGIHAEPISLGLKFCGFYQEVQRCLQRVERAREIISFGKISGAVGTFAHLDPAVEIFACRKLGLEPEPVATQVIPRDRYAEFVCQLAVVGAGLERFALEVRHLQRTEVAEAAEPFGRNQKGSSAMPHKQNPILSERICGLARILRANSTAALENVALWHERDISHSSVERVILPDSTILLDYLIHLSIRVFKGLRIDSRKMAENLQLTGGLIFSQRVLTALVGRGLPRPDAYRMVQRNALAAIEKKIAFRDCLEKDPDIGRHLGRKDLNDCFDPAYFLRHQAEIFRRVFAKSGGRKRKSR